VSKHFDKELNEFPCGHSPTKPLSSAVNERSYEYASKRCAAVGFCEMGDSTQPTSCCENESVCNVNVDRQANVHSFDAKTCRFKAKSWQQPKQEIHCMTSLSAEPESDAADFDNDVGWFFEDRSDIYVCREQQTCDGVSQVSHSVNMVADVSQNGMIYSDKLHKSVPPVLVEMIPFQKDLDGRVMPALNVADVHEENSCVDNLAQHVSTLLMVNESHEFSGHSERNFANCASVVSSSEHCIQSTGNTEQPSSSSQSLQDTDKESDEKLAAILPQTDLLTVPQEIKSIVTSVTADHKSLCRRSSNVSDGKLHNSRILLHSRHFQSVKTATHDVTAEEDDLPDKITTDDDMYDCNLLSPLLLSELSHQSNFNDAVADKNKSSKDHISFVYQQTANFAVNVTSEKNKARVPAYFDRLKMIGMHLGHADEELMQLAVEICRQQLAPNPVQTWFVYSVFRLVNLFESSSNFMSKAELYPIPVLNPSVHLTNKWFLQRLLYFK